MGFTLPTGKHHGNGFTLIELVITLAVVTILITSVAPSMAGLINDTRMATRVNVLVTTLAQARAKSVFSGHNAVICPSTDGIGCNRSFHWESGWITFLDENADGAPDPDEQRLNHQQATRGGAILTTAARTRITFRSSGTRLNPGSSAGSNTTFTFCDPRGPEHAVAVVLSNTGRPRIVDPAEPRHAARCPAEP